jgi:transmembrane sensor
MSGTSDIGSEALAAYVAGEADAALRAAVERWAQADPANARELGALLRAWQWAGEEPSMPEVDVDAAWQRVLQRAEAAPAKGRVLPIRKAMRWMAAAATVAGLVLATRLLMGPQGQEFATSGDFLASTLVDGSTVVLSPHSRMEADMDGKRGIKLQGAAYFEVKRDAARAFTVEAGPVQVAVLGTGFEVSAYDTAKVVRVAVRHGQVRVTAGKDTLELLAGEVAGYERATGRLRRLALPSSLVWGDRIVQFKEAPLDEVAHRLESMYGVTIELAAPAISNCRLTADFDNEDIGRVLKVVAETFGLTLEQPEQGRYILEGDGC